MKDEAREKAYYLARLRYEDVSPVLSNDPDEVPELVVERDLKRGVAARAAIRHVLRHQPPTDEEVIARALDAASHDPEAFREEIEDWFAEAFYHHEHSDVLPGATARAMLALKPLFAHSYSFMWEASLDRKRLAGYALRAIAQTDGDLPAAFARVVPHTFRDGFGTHTTTILRQMAQSGRPNLVRDVVAKVKETLTEDEFNVWYEKLKAEPWGET